MDAAQIEKLKALALAASPGPWQWWTSNSTLRLTGADGRDGGVLYGYVHSGDGDVYCSEPNRAFIEASNPATVLELIAENERLRADPLYSTRQDADRFRSAIALEDNAYSLYAAVLNNASDGAAIRREFDAAIGARTKAETEKGPT